MPDNEPQLISYADVLQKLEKSKPNNHLLIANGFNLSLGIKTDYKSILKQMGKNNKEYESVITGNFDLEEFIGACKSQIRESDNPYLDFMKRYYHNKIKLDFMKAVKQIVSKEMKNIALVEKEEIEKIDDGFGLFGKDIIFKNPQTQNLIFLHGAFHIYQRGKVIHKITQQSEKALYQKIEEVVENADEYIICVFSDTNKEIEISHNEYLRNGLRKLAEIEGSLLIIGSSLADNDAHIFEKVNQSKIQRIFIASCEKDKAKDYRNARKFWSEKEVALFDRDTVSYAK